MDSGLSQSEAFPPLSPDRSDVARERDVMLPIKGSACGRSGHSIPTFGHGHLVSLVETGVQ